MLLKRKTVRSEGSMDPGMTATHVGREVTDRKLLPQVNCYLLRR